MEVMPKKQITVCVCKFRRQPNAPLEEGLMINYEQLIIDMDGKTVPSPVYDYTLHEYEGCFIFKQ